MKSRLSSEPLLGGTAELGGFNMKGFAELDLGAGRLLKRDAKLNPDMNIIGQQ